MSSSFSERIREKQNKLREYAAAKISDTPQTTKPVVGEETTEQYSNPMDNPLQENFQADTDFSMLMDDSENVQPQNTLEPAQEEAKAEISVPEELQPDLLATIAATKTAEEENIDLELVLAEEANENQTGLLAANDPQPEVLPQAEPETAPVLKEPGEEKAKSKKNSKPKTAKKAEAMENSVQLVPEEQTDPYDDDIIYEPYELTALMNKIVRGGVIDNDWDKIQADLTARYLKTIIEDVDLVPSVVIMALIELYHLNLEASRHLFTYETQYLDLTDKEDGYVTRVKANNSTGVNEATRKRNANRAVERYLVDGKPVNLYEFAYDLRKKVMFLKMLISNSAKCHSNLITVAGLMKIDLSLAPMIGGDYNESTNGKKYRKAS